MHSSNGGHATSTASRRQHVELGSAINFRCKRTLRLFRYVAMVVCIPTMATQGQNMAGNFANTLLPAASTLRVGVGYLPMGASFSVGLSGYRDGRLERATQRMIGRLEYESGNPIPRDLVRDAWAAVMVVDVRGQGQMVQGLEEDESYSVQVTGERLTLRAATVVGALRGMETVLQLVQHRDGKAVFPVVSIDDAPRFRWRGLMIDCGRHFEPVPVIERTLDGMAAVKLNVFHWHLSDDQGFRVESKRFPKLHGMGSDGLYYTQEQVKEVVAYAYDRGIRVVPEFDMPGHATSWFVGYPELASAEGPYEVKRVFGIHDAAMDPTRPSVYEFLDAFVGEMTTLFPDAYFHVGGDESNGKQWRASERIQAFMRVHGLKDTDALQAYFNQQLLKILVKHHRQMVGWDEVLNPALPKDVVVQSWRGVKSLGDGARQGYRGLLSAPYYLDGMKSSATHYAADPLPEGMTEAGLGLGGEICMWGEQIDGQTIDSRLWPRSAALAERFWSPREVRDENDMYRRLGVESVRLEALGLTHLSGPQAMVRSLAGEPNPVLLERLAAVVEPVSFGERYDTQQTSQLTPLDRLVDAVVPDPPSRQRIAGLVDGLIADPQHQAGRAELERMFRDWVAVSPGLDAMVAGSARLADAEPRVKQLAEAGAIGLEALGYLDAGRTGTTDWRERRLGSLTEAEKPAALVRFTFLPSLRKLVMAAAPEGSGKS